MAGWSIHDRPPSNPSRGVPAHVLPFRPVPVAHPASAAPAAAARRRAGPAAGPGPAGRPGRRPADRARRARQWLSRARRRTQGHRRCPARAAALAQPARRPARAAADPHAAVDRTRRAARTQAGRPPPQPAQLFAQPLHLRHRPVADGGRHRQGAPHRRPAQAAVHRRHVLVARPEAHRAEPAGSQHRRQRAVAGRRGRAQGAQAAGPAAQHRHRRRPLDARQQAPAGPPAHGAGRRARRRHHPRRAQHAGSARRRRGAPAAHLPGHAAQPQRRAHLRTLPARAAGAGVAGRQGAQRRQARPVRRPRSVARRQAPAVAAHRAPVFVRRADELLPAPNRSHRPRRQGAARSREAAAVRGPAQRQRCDDHRRAQRLVAQRRPGQPGLGRGAGRRRPVEAGRDPRPRLPAGRAVRQAAGAAREARQPLRRHRVGTRRRRPARRILVEDAQGQELEDRARRPADRAGPGVRRFQRRPLQRPGQPGERARRERFCAPEVRARRQEHLPDRRWRLARRRPPVPRPLEPRRQQQAAPVSLGSALLQRRGRRARRQRRQGADHPRIADRTEQPLPISRPRRHRSRSPRSRIPRRSSRT